MRGCGLALLVAWSASSIRDNKIGVHTAIVVSTNSRSTDHRPTTRLGSRFGVRGSRSGLTCCFSALGCVDLRT
jgi:hypothetical protein